jgi:hypothetical protein
MNLNDLKEKVKTFLKEDADEHKDEEYSFKDTFQYRQMKIAVGFVVGIMTAMVIEPNILTSVLNFENMTILGFATYAFAAYILMIGCESVGGFIIGKAEVIYGDIMQRAKAPKIFSDSIIIIVLIIFLALKLIYPTVAGGVK